MDDDNDEIIKYLNLIYFRPIKLRGMFPLIDNTAKDFVIRIKELLKAKYKENSKEGLNNIENNTFRDVNTVTDVNNSEEYQEDNTSDKKAMISGITHGVDKNKNNTILVDLNLEANKNNGYLVSKLENKYKNANVTTDVEHNKEYIHVNGKHDIHNEEDKENHHATQIRNKNCDSLAKSNTSKGKLTSAVTTQQKHVNGNVYKDIDDTKDEIYDESADVDSERLVGGYTADAIVPCAFGLKSNVMYDDKDPFAVALQAFYEMSVFNIFEK